MLMLDGMPALPVKIDPAESQRRVRGQSDVTPV